MRTWNRRLRNCLAIEISSNYISWYPYRCMRACVYKSFPLCDYNFEYDFKFGDASISQSLYDEYVRWDSVSEQMPRRCKYSGNMVYNTHTHWDKRFIFPINMMTSSNGNIFRATGHLCGEFTGPRWIPHTKASDAELWCLLWSAPE